MAEVSPAEVEEEENRQREIVLTRLQAEQNRLDDLADPLLRAALPLCPEDASPYAGIRVSSLATYDEEEWRDAATAALGLDGSVQVIHVTENGPADRAGVRPGDRLREVAGHAVVSGDDAAADAMEALQAALAQNRGGSLELVVERDGRTRRVSLSPGERCGYTTLVTVEGNINAFADGERLIFPWAMMRFAEDDELRVVLAHEVAHNAMGHIDAKKGNALLAGLAGALLDVASATQGVQTGGAYTSEFAALGARTFSQDFEREADYVGLYIMARAGLDLSEAPLFWREFAQINPAAIGYASSHPTTAERFVRLRSTVEEIEAKAQLGEALLPNLKDPEKD
jgi:predicted Zn-dependent protease